MFSYVFSLQLNEETLFYWLDMHLEGIELMTSPSTLLFQGEDMPFELKLIDN